MATRRSSPLPRSPGRIPCETTRLLATEIERARRFGFTTEELDAAKRDVMNRYAEAAAERETSESSSLADELGRHFFTDEPVPGIAWEYERVKQVVPVADARGRQRPRAAWCCPSRAASRSSWWRRRRRRARRRRPCAPPSTEVLKADITPYRGVKVETQLLEQQPRARAGWSPKRTTPRSARRRSTYANGVHVVLKPTTFKSDEVLLSAARYGGQYLYDEADHQNAVHLVQTIDAMGYGVAQPDGAAAVPEHQARRTPSVSFTPYTEEVDGASTRDDIDTLLQLVYLKLTAPRLDAARFEANRTALKGYLASLWNSPMTQYEDFTMATLSQGHPRAPRVAKADRSRQGRSRALGRDVPRAVRQCRAG